jgi:hypothetical protein
MAPGVLITDLERILRTIAAVESSGGRNNWPRLEPAYIPEGLEFTVQGRIVRGTGKLVNQVVRRRWDRWGLESAASWSPWQILYHTAADLGYEGMPHRLHDPDIARPWVERLVARIIARGATTPEQIADAWNSGTHKDNIVPHEYIEKFMKAWRGEV